MKLFWKIFLAFALATVATVVLTIVLTVSLGAEPAGGGRRGPPPNAWIRFTVAGCSTLAIGYLVARALSQRLGKIQSAARRIGRGELGARADLEPAWLGDEIDSLGREFDAMASSLETSIRSQRQLIQDVSHELRAPLARLQIAVGLVRRDGVEAAERALDRIDHEVECLAALYEELLSLAKLEAGSSAYAATRVQLGPLVEGVVEDAQFASEEEGRPIDLRVEDGCVVDGDARLLSRAIENVVRNAVAHSPDGTPIAVRLRPDGPFAVVEVEDEGEGVPEEELERIFQPFVRLGEARPRAVEGAGLGLAIVARSVAAHGGSVRATNNERGGLTVVLRLPRAQVG